MPHSSNPVHGQRSDARSNILRRVVHTVKTKVADTKRKLTDKFPGVCRVSRVAFDYALTAATGEKARGFMKRFLDREPLYPLAADMCEALEEEFGRLFDILLDYVHEKGTNNKMFDILDVGLEFMKETWTNTKDKKRYTILLVNYLATSLSPTSQFVGIIKRIIVGLIYIYSALKAKDKKVARNLLAELAATVFVTEASHWFPRDGYLSRFIADGTLFCIMDYLRTPKGKEDVDTILQYLRSKFTNNADAQPAADGDG